MPTFEIEMDDGVYEVDAEDQATAVQALESMLANPASNLAYGEVPEGMVLDPKTNRMVDAGAIAKDIGRGWAPAFAKGLPFIGEYFDEAVGMGDPVRTQITREAAKQFEDENPWTTTAGQLAASATAIPATVMAAAPIAGVSLPGGMVTQTLAGGVAAGAGGLGEGFVSGYGEGEGDGRLQSAQDRAVSSGLTATAVGAVSPWIAKGVEKAARNIMDRRTIDRAAREVGMTPDTARIVNRAMVADDAFNGQGIANMTRAGDDAMLADTGPAAQSLLDTTVQKSGAGSRIARQAVEKRAADAASRLRSTMDLTLGQPEGINKAARDIAQKTAAQRKFYYDASYQTPIDYASKAGRKIEDVFNRTPPSILRSAINEANDAMQVAGERNMQILADIADDGSVKFRQMPNVRQADELKKALGSISRETDQFGRPTAVALRAGKLSKELRASLGEAVPVYNKAVQLGGDKIAEDKALELGYNLLSPSMTREAVHEATDGITAAEQKKVALGLRQKVDDMMANVTAAITDPNVDAREAMKVWKELSSKANREKVFAAIGEKRATPIFNELERVGASLGIKASVRDNSRTFVRDSTERAVNAMTQPNIVEQAVSGAPLKATQRIMQNATNTTPEDILARQDVVFEDLANILTGPRGADAANTLKTLEMIYRQDPRNAAMSSILGRTGAATVGLPTYSEGRKPLQSLLTGSGER